MDLGHPGQRPRTLKPKIKFPSNVGNALYVIVILFVSMNERESELLVYGFI